MKIIQKLLTTLLVIVFILIITTIGGYIYVRTTYGIDLLRTAGQLNNLTKEVDENTLCRNSFGENDFVSMKEEINKKFENLIVYEENKEYNGYSINPSAIVGKKLNSPISLTEKQVGALAQTAFYKQTGGKLKINEKDILVNIMQIDFLNISENGSADFNIIAKLNLNPFKEDMEKFPYKYLKKYIPEYLYASSTVHVEKKEEGFNYELTHKSLTINNLSIEDTIDLLTTLDKVLKIGTLESINMLIGTTIVNAFIGNKDNPGFAYLLKAANATTFNFGTINEKDWFAIY